MNTSTEYPLTFAEAEEIAKAGGVVEAEYHKNAIEACHYFINEQGEWCYLGEDGQTGLSSVIHLPPPNNLRNSKWRIVPPLAPAWELQDNEIGKD